MLAQSKLIAVTRLLITQTHSPIDSPKPFCYTLSRSMKSFRDPLRSQSNSTQRMRAGLPISQFRRVTEGVKHDRLFRLLKPILTVRGQCGTPAGARSAQLPAHLQRNGGQGMLDCAKEGAREGRYSTFEYAFIADGPVVPAYCHRRGDPPFHQD